jgi:hypothetical protein
VVAKQRHCECTTADDSEVYVVIISSKMGNFVEHNTTGYKRTRWLQRDICRSDGDNLRKAASRNVKYLMGTGLYHERT